MTKLPYRITFLAPMLTLPVKDKKLQVPLATLLHGALCQAFACDPEVTFKDTSAFGIVRGDELVNIAHREIEEIIATELRVGFRHEVSWLEIDLVKDHAVKLCGRGPDGPTLDVSSKEPTLADAIHACLSEWRTLRGLGPRARTLHAFTKDELLAAARADQKELRADPAGPAALLSHYLEVEKPAAPKDFSPLARIVSLAPNYAPTYRHFRGEGVDDHQAHDALAMLVALDPADDDAVERYGRALSEDGALEAGHRLAIRAAKIAPHAFNHIYAVLETATDLVRPGYQLAEAERRLAEAAEGEFADWFHLGNPDVVFVHLAHANAHFFAGRLEEAIALRGRVLEDKGGSWPNQTRVLEEWKTLTERLAMSYANEGRARGDLGRVLEAYSLALPETASGIANAVDTLCDLGEPQLALLAFEHARGRSTRSNPAARLAGALAAMCSGELEAAVLQLLAIELRFARQGLETQVNRVLRAGAGIPLGAWEKEIAWRAADGATRLARVVARWAADFVPGAAGSRTVNAALAPVDAHAFEHAWLDPLAKELLGKKAAATRRRLDAALTPDPRGGLVAADLLATRFWDVLAEDRDARARELVYVAVSAVCRYLASTTLSPDPLSGGYRQAAALAFQAVANAEIPTPVLASALAAIERASHGVDPWTFDAWLLVTERALRIEERTHGLPESFTRGLPNVREALRGDIAIGYELALADRIASADPASAHCLYERCLRAGSASNVGYRLFAAAKRAKKSRAEVVDAAFLSLVSAPGAAAPAITVAEDAFAEQRPLTALRVLTAHFARGGKTWREKQIEALAPAWGAAGLDVPIEFDAAQTVALSALSSGDFEKARRAYAWCDAQDPNNAVTLKNLGMVFARLGDARSALASFAQADRALAPTWTAHELMASQKFTESMPAHRYASIFYDRAELFIYAAKSAWFAGDDETKLAAIQRAYALDPASVDLTFLNGLADAAATFGLDADCAAAANELLLRGKGDATFTSLAHHHLALTLLRAGKTNEALSHAKEAVKTNPEPDNQAELEERLRRCKTNDPEAPTPMRRSAPSARAFERLLGGDATGALTAVEEARDGAAALARVVAARFREKGEEGVIVTARALAAARDVLDGTAGATDAPSALARAAAMKIVEDALAPLSPPPTLGQRLSRDEFRKAYLERGGVIRQPTEILP